MLERNPIPGGWQRLVRLSRAAGIEGALVKVMINPTQYAPGAPAYDPARRALDEAGNPRRWPQISPYFAPELTRQALDSLLAKGFQLDALYFDGYAAHAGVPEDHSTSHPLPRRLAIRKNAGKFSGKHAGAESLQAPSCRGSGPWRNATSSFSGPAGPRKSWEWENPFRCFNWSSTNAMRAAFRAAATVATTGPGTGSRGCTNSCSGRLRPTTGCCPTAMPIRGRGFTEVPVADWESPRVRDRLVWLKRWRAFYRATAWSEMVSHRFLNTERTLQQVEYANGVKADFDLAAGLCRVQGVAGFSGEWEKPHTGQI